MKTLIILFTFVFLSGCASQKKLNLREELNTEIKADGSKIFEFSVFLLHEKQSRPGKKDRKDKNNDPQRRGEKPRGAQRDNSNSDELSEYFDKRLSNLPIISLFCREQYFVLDRLNAKDEITVRAECHDSASEDDYVRFKSAKLPTKN
ncbi:hypothetical protein ACOYR1_15925 [Thalassotalea piscium]